MEGGGRISGWVIQGGGGEKGEGWPEMGVNGWAGGWVVGFVEGVGRAVGNVCFQLMGFVVDVAAVCC